MLDFIVNVKARRGKALAAWKRLETRLKAGGYEYAFHPTERKGHAREIAAAVCAEDRYKTIIALGGDGTVHEILNGLSDFARLTFGIIPAGTGNDFAASLKLPKNPQKALDVVLFGRRGFVDFYECGGVRGANVAGAGIDADILRHYASKKRRGKLQYALSLLHCIRHFKPYEIVEKTQDGGFRERKIFIAAVCNGSQFGGGIKICPPADPKDGKLDCIVVDSLPPRKYVSALIRLALGKITEINTCEYRTAESFGFETSLPLELDGEIYTDLPFDVKIVKNTLEMCLPK